MRDPTAAGIDAAGAVSIVIAQLGVQRL